MQVSIFDEELRGVYAQGSGQYFKLTNFYESSQEIYRDFSKKNEAKKKSVFSTMPYFKDISRKDCAAGYVINDELGYVSYSDIGVGNVNERYNIPVFYEPSKEPYITYPTYHYRQDFSKPVLVSRDLKGNVINDSRTEIYKLKEQLSKQNIVVLDGIDIKNRHPIFTKYYHLIIYTFSGLDFFFYARKIQEAESGSNKWEVIKIQYDGAMIQQILELHGYLFIFLKDKTVVYSLAYGDSSSASSYIDISESSGQNLPIGTDNTFSVVKHLNRIITLYNNGVYTITQFQPTKISLPEVDEWITKQKELSLFIIKEQSYEFLYVVSQENNQGWVLNFHNNRWSYVTNIEVYKPIEYNNHVRFGSKYISKVGGVCEYCNGVQGEGKYIIETGYLSLGNGYNMITISEILIIFNHIPKESVRLLIDYKLNGDDKWQRSSEEEVQRDKFQEGGNVLHKRIKLRASQFALRLTFICAKYHEEPIIIEDIVLNTS